MRQWTWASVPRLDGRHALVTGGNRGVGFEIAKGLARAGASVTILCRDPAAGEVARGKINDELSSGAAPVLPPIACDLSSLDSVHAAVESVAERPLPDLVIANAGVVQLEGARMTVNRAAGGWPVAADAVGNAAVFERQLATNHLGHFALVGKLLPRLVKQTRADGSDFPGSRVVAVSSLSAWISQQETIRAEIERLGGKDGPAKKEHPFVSYAVSKAANLLWSQELRRRCAAANNGVTAVAAHPGAADTGMIPNGSMPRWMLQSASDAAGPIFRAATDADNAGTPFWGPRVNFLAITSYGLPPLPAYVPPPAKDEALANSLWDASEAATGVRYSL